MRRDDYLAAVVACWLDKGLLNPSSPFGSDAWIDGANDPREFVDGDYMDARDLIEELVEDGFLEAKGDEDWVTSVRPTAKCLFEVLR